MPIIKYIELAEYNNFGALSITDHNSIESHQDIIEYQKETDVLLIPGQEISTLDGHLLIYGFIDLLPRDLGMNETVQKAKTMGAKQKTEVICIAAHPFDFLRSGGGKKALASGVDGMETLNASSLFGFINWRARNYWMTTDLIALGNSDSHRSSEFAIAYSEIPRVNTVAEILKNLTHAVPAGKRIGLWKKVNRYSRRKLGKMTI